MTISNPGLEFNPLFTMLAEYPASAASRYLPEQGAVVSCTLI